MEEQALVQERHAMVVKTFFFPRSLPKMIDPPQGGDDWSRSSCSTLTSPGYGMSASSVTALPQPPVESLDDVSLDEEWVSCALSSSCCSTVAPPWFSPPEPSAAPSSYCLSTSSSAGDSSLLSSSSPSWGGHCPLLDNG